MAPILAPLLGVLFLRGHISLKNWTYCPVLRVRATPFKSDLYRITDSGMSLYLPPYGRGCFFNAHQKCRIEPGLCIMARSVPRLKISICNEYYIHWIFLSIEADDLSNQIIPASNREGVELQFHQSYRFEITTNPSGKHYIIF
jgi:hypothetical protein